MSIEAKFRKLGTDNAPGQEVRQQTADIDSLLRGEVISGRPVDFSHGDVDAHEPAPGSFDLFSTGVALGVAQAYTEYRGDIGIREEVGASLAAFTGAPVDARDGMIITPGTQGRCSSLWPRSYRAAKRSRSSSPTISPTASWSSSSKAT